VTETILCLDTSILIKALCPDELSEAAVQLVRRGFAEEIQIVQPAWAWAEFGSVLRKKARTDILAIDETNVIWQAFCSLPIDYVNSVSLQKRAWQLAQTYQLPTLYDAVFLACTEMALTSEEATREFWTADRTLLNSLGNAKPDYVRGLTT
jgi:predicted nucleic acid-binding protein